MDQNESILKKIDMSYIMCALKIRTESAPITSNTKTIQTCNYSDIPTSVSEK